MNTSICRIAVSWALLAAAVMAEPAWAIHKCVDATGRVSFQDAPCPGRGGAIDVRPASGAAPVQSPGQAVQSPGGSSAQPTASTQKEGPFGARWQRRTYLEQRGVPDAIANVDHVKRSCERKLGELESLKATASNNLAGATYLQSLSAQMQAEATMCDLKSREALARQQELSAELRALQADR